MSNLIITPLEDPLPNLLSIVALNPDLSIQFACIGILLIMVLLTASALISGSEVAFFSLKPAEMEYLRQDKSKQAQLALQLLDRPDYLLSSILFGNNAVNISTVMLATSVSSSVLVFESDLYKFLVEVVLITFLLLLFGEITPKIFASQNALRFACVMAYPLSLLEKISRPFSWLLVGAGSKMNKHLRKVKRTDLSIDDLSSALNITQTSSAEDRQILKGIVSFGNTDVRTIMTPRIDVAAIDIDVSYKELLAEIVEQEYSRMPVYKDNLDSISGILYLKDLLPHLDEAETFHWQQIIRPAFFVPENKKINDLLTEFQGHKNHMAIVVDEYGGTSGIITLEDILEEIVGEISDESDMDQRWYVQQSDGSYLFEGKTQLHDFCKIMHIDDSYFEAAQGESETLAGLLLELKGEFPSEADDLRWGKFLFKVAGIEGRRIHKVRVTVRPEVVGKK